MEAENGGRSQFSSEERVKAVRRHVLGGEAVLRIPEAMGIGPNLFYRWQELFDHGATAFEVRGRGRKAQARAERLKREIARLRERLAHKGEDRAQTS